MCGERGELIRPQGDTFATERNDGWAFDLQSANMSAKWRVIHCRGYPHGEEWFELTRLTACRAPHAACFKPNAQMILYVPRPAMRQCVK